jgi:mRNA deadenylase 3'-5' endonuclease subunit Ccr4
MKSMTFNILCAGRGENHWCLRQKLVREIIKKYAPDTFGLQEVHYAWMRYIINQFKDTYDFVGVGKDDGKKKGEFSLFFITSTSMNCFRKRIFGFPKRRKNQALAGTVQKTEPAPMPF